jgi:hypothetical protein
MHIALTIFWLGCSLFAFISIVLKIVSTERTANDVEKTVNDIQRRIYSIELQSDWIYKNTPSKSHRKFKRHPRTYKRLTNKIDKHE